MPMHSLGHTFVPAPIHAGGLRYHGVAPLISQLVNDKLIEPRAYHQLVCYEAAVQWARTEGFVSAPETSHALASVVEEANKAKEEGKEKVILVNWSGHGLMDLVGYDKYFAGELTDYELPDTDLEKYKASMADFPKPVLG
jgi:tryptophan synthase beta chain